MQDVLKPRDSPASFIVSSHLETNVPQKDALDIMVSSSKTETDGVPDTDVDLYERHAQATRMPSISLRY